MVCMQQPFSLKVQDVPWIFQRIVQVTGYVIRIRFAVLLMELQGSTILPAQRL